MQRTTTFRPSKPDPLRVLLQCINQTSENEVSAVAIAPLRPKVAEIDDDSFTGELDKISAAVEYDGALCSFKSCEATIT